MYGDEFTLRPSGRDPKIKQKNNVVQMAIQVKPFKEFTDMKDKFLIAAVDENRHVVFMTSM